MVVRGRRAALRALFTFSVVAFTGGALARIAATTPTRRTGAPGRTGDTFAEMYRGRRIEVGRAAVAYGATGTDGGGPEARVDGRRLPVMRCADGGYLTPVDHYASYPTPLEAVRAAVDELGTAQLADTHGGAHGVHA
ncbi:tyrosinase family oxidase copper chaperone, partial [Streptomyces sp. NRRL S-118]|uniref:tyrosinase family oxidase copper chaperone n=1 Tax=Streptomyces sp. NRRL S-118 TaxID=1463881 RepID=UPI0004C76CD1